MGTSRKVALMRRGDAEVVVLLQGARSSLLHHAAELVALLGHLGNIVPHASF